MALFLLFLLPVLVNSQSLVLIGGGLSDENAAVWNKVVELAVILKENSYYNTQFIF